MKLVHIHKDGTMDDIDCSKLNLKNVCKKLTEVSKSQGNNALKLLYTWKYEDYSILCYGWYDGEAGFENKHDLPVSGSSSFLETDSSEQLLFGDLFMLKQQNKKFCDFEISTYGEFYTYAFGGFDDCDTDDESVNTISEDEDYQPEEEEEEELESDCDMDEEDIELEEDTNEY